MGKISTYICDGCGAVTSQPVRWWSVTPLTKENKEVFFLITNFIQPDYDRTGETLDFCSVECKDKWKEKQHGT